jgi:glutathione S-transferase
LEYIDVEEAQTRPGLRLVLTTGVPGPWGEAAKSIFTLKKIPFVPVRQTAGEVSEALRQWTGQTSAPVAAYEDERPRSGWAEILFLAERLGPQPSLVPEDPAERARMMGLCHEICGEQGLGWSRRLMLFDAVFRDTPVEERGAMPWKYGYEPDADARATSRVAELLDLFSATLRAQQAVGSKYMMGEQLSALDIYWATFAALLCPLPHDQCPMPKWLRPAYDMTSSPESPVVDPILLDHRDFIYNEHLELPLDF